MLPKQRIPLGSLAQKVRPIKKHFKQCMMPWPPFQGRKVGRILMTTVMTNPEGDEVVETEPNRPGLPLLRKTQRRLPNTSRMFSFFFYFIISCMFTPNTPVSLHGYSCMFAPNIPVSLHGAIRSWKVSAEKELKKKLEKAIRGLQPKNCF